VRRLRTALVTTIKCLAHSSALILREVVMRRIPFALTVFALLVSPLAARADVPAVAEAPPTAQPETPTSAPTNAPGRWLVHVNFGVPVVSYLGTMGTQTEAWVTPANRFTTVQLVGAGYWVHPHLRLNLMVQFAETLSGLPPTASPFTTFAVIAWAAYTNGPFFAGLGGIVAPRSFGSWDTDAGIFACAGVGVPLGGGFTLGAAVQTPLMLLRRVSFVVGPNVFLSYRF
jgi:hypothetical protein